MKEKLRSQCLMSGMWGAGVCFHFREPAWMTKPLTMHWLRYLLGKGSRAMQGSYPVCHRRLCYTQPGGVGQEDRIWKGKEWMVSKTKCVQTLSALLLFLFLLAVGRGGRRHNKPFSFPLHLQHCTYMKIFPHFLCYIKKSKKEQENQPWSPQENISLPVLWRSLFCLGSCKHGNTCWGVNLVLYFLQAVTRQKLG